MGVCVCACVCVLRKDNFYAFECIHVGQLLSYGHTFICVNRK